MFNFIKNLPRGWLFILGIVILIVAIPVTLYLVRQQQILRSRATGTQTVSFALNPPVSQIPVDQEFEVKVEVKTEGLDVSGVDLKATYERTKLSVVSFTPRTSNFIQVTRSLSPGSFSYVGVNPAREPRRGDVDIGTLKLKLLSAATTGGPVQFNFDAASKAVATLRDGFVSSDGNINGSYSPPGASPTPSPTPTPTPVPGAANITGISGLPTPCITGVLTDPQKISGLINWSAAANTPGLAYWVDIDTDEAFSGEFFHKEVSFQSPSDRTRSTNLSGFNLFAGVNIPVSGQLELDFRAGQRYFVKVFDPETQKTSNKTVLQINTCPTPSPSPSPSPTPVAAACSNAVPVGLLVAQNRLGDNGESIFPIISDGSNVRLSVTRIPADAQINSTPAIISPSSAPAVSINPIAGSADKLIRIPSNTSQTTINKYRIDTTVGTTPTPAACPSFIIEVAPKPAVSACIYFGTEVRIKGPNGWIRNKSIKIGEKVTLAAFHKTTLANSSWGYLNNNLATDVFITVREPDGSNHIINVNPDSGSILTQVDFTPMKPTAPGQSYKFSGETKDMEPGAHNECVDNSAEVTVESFAATTTSVRIAESPEGLAAATDIPYTATPLTVPYSFVNKTVDKEHEIWVKFTGTGAAGERTEKVEGPFKITIVSPDPIVSPLSCDLGVDNTVRFTVNGSNFGAAQGRNGSVKTGQTALKIDSWSNTEVRATLEQTATVGQSFPVILTRNDGVAAESTVCSVAISQLQLGANFFCRQALTQTLSNVTATVAEGREGGSVAQETVSIGANGLISGLKTKLQQGRGYRIGIKAPGTLRRVVEFIAGKGTTKLSSLDLPVGDIFPAIGDGKINSADFGQMIREWVVAQAATGEKRADLNGDGRVNSFDWACMRPFFNATDDSEPEAGPLPPNITPPPGINININIGTSAPVLPSTPTSSPTPTGTSTTPTPSPSAGPSPTPSPSATAGNATPSPSPTPTP